MLSSGRSVARSPSNCATRAHGAPIPILRANCLSERTTKARNLNSDASPVRFEFGRRRQRCPKRSDLRVPHRCANEMQSALTSCTMMQPPRATAAHVRKVRGGAQRTLAGAGSRAIGPSGEVATHKRHTRAAGRKRNANLRASRKLDFALYVRVSIEPVSALAFCFFGHFATLPIRLDRVGLHSNNNKADVWIASRCVRLLCKFESNMRIIL